ncbi:MAG: Uma2 family endonuclease [Ktedonobacterales bacterium]
MGHATFAPWGELVPGVGPMTADELLQRPEYETGYELVEGRLIRVPPAGMEHGDLGLELGSALRGYVRTQNLGRVFAAETGFTLNRPGEPDVVLAPDCAFVRTDRLPDKGSADWKGFARLAPDLVVEIASPSQYAPELAEKARLWLAAGTRLAWVVWPSTRHVDVWLPGGELPAQSLGPADSLDGRDVIPGFTYSVASLFG